MRQLRNVNLERRRIHTVLPKIDHTHSLTGDTCPLWTHVPTERRKIGYLGFWNVGNLCGRTWAKGGQNQAGGGGWSDNGDTWGLLRKTGPAINFLWRRQPGPTESNTQVKFGLIKCSPVISFVPQLFSGCLARTAALGLWVCQSGSGWRRQSLGKLEAILKDLVTGQKQAECHQVHRTPLF